MPKAPFSAGQPDNAAKALAALMYLPPANTFVPASAEIFTSTGTYPVVGTARISGIPCLVSGNWMAGHRQNVAASDAHSHLMLLDPQIEVRDPYRGNGQAVGTTVDAVRISGESSTTTYSPWRYVVMSFVTVVPGIGRRKVVVLDERFAYPASTYLRDSFTDTAGTLLENHTMDVGNAWLAHANNSLKINPSGSVDLVTSTTGGWARADGGFDAGFVVATVNVNADDAGVLFRGADDSNFLSVRLSTTAFSGYKRVAGVDSQLFSVAASPVAGTNHTIKVDLTSAGTFKAYWDGANEQDVISNIAGTYAGVIILSDAGGNHGKVSNFIYSADGT
jgi:hypothetical protein